MKFKKKYKESEKNTNIYSGFFISFKDSPKLNIAISSLSLWNLINVRTRPKIITKGNVIFIKFGNNHKERPNIFKNSIWKLFIIENNLDNCINQAIDTKMKKTSVQDLTIWLNTYKFILFIYVYYY